MLSGLLELSNWFPQHFKYLIETNTENFHQVTIRFEYKWWLVSQFNLPSIRCTYSTN